jgi:DNA-binding transcriptional LysR family regulator
VARLTTGSGFDSHPPPPPHLDNPLVVIAPLSHRLARRRKLSLADIRDESFILREPGAATRRACNAHFEKHRFQPKVRLELGSNEAIKQAVAGSLGLGVISRHAVAMAPEDEGLAILSVASFPIQSKWWVLYPRGKRLSPVAAEFMTYLDKTFESLRS